MLVTLFPDTDRPTYHRLLVGRRCDGLSMGKVCSISDVRLTPTAASQIPAGRVGFYFLSGCSTQEVPLLEGTIVEVDNIRDSGSQILCTGLLIDRDSYYTLDDIRDGLAKAGWRIELAMIGSQVLVVCPNVSEDDSRSLIPIADTDTVSLRLSQVPGVRKVSRWWDTVALGAFARVGGRPSVAASVGANRNGRTL